MSPRNGQGSYICAITIWLPEQDMNNDMLTWKGEISWGPTPRQRTTDKEGMLREGELIFPKDEPPIGYPIISGQLWSQIHTSNWASFIYIF